MSARLPNGERKHRGALTEREAEVEAMILQGSQQYQIAGALGISEDTVKAHFRTICLKRGVSSKLDLIFSRCDVIPRTKSRAAGA